VLMGSDVYNIVKLLKHSSNHNGSNELINDLSNIYLYIINGKAENAIKEKLLIHVLDGFLFYSQFETVLEILSKLQLSKFALNLICELSLHHAFHNKINIKNALRLCDDFSVIIADLKIDNILRQSDIKFISKKQISRLLKLYFESSVNLNYLLESFALHQMFYQSEPDIYQIERLKSTINIDWALDLKNKLIAAN